MTVEPHLSSHLSRDKFWNQFPFLNRNWLPYPVIWTRTVSLGTEVTVRISQAPLYKVAVNNKHFSFVLMVGEVSFCTFGQNFGKKCLLLTAPYDNFCFWPTFLDIESIHISTWARLVLSCSWLVSKHSVSGTPTALAAFRNWFTTSICLNVSFSLFFTNLSGTLCVRWCATLKKITKWSWNVSIFHANMKFNCLNCQINMWQPQVLV